jgi:tellurite resistance protein TerC
MTMGVLIWTGFVLLILAFLALDLGVLNKKDHVIGFRESVRWTLMWITVSLLFTPVVWALYRYNVAGFGLHPGLESSAPDAVMNYLAGYVLEYSLSVDNIFVIALLIKAFKVPDKLQHRVLFWGILGALLLRGGMIAAGALLLHEFAWMMYVFGGILLLTSAKMAFSKEDDAEEITDSWVIRLVRRFYAVTPDYHGHHFFARVDGRHAVTPLLVVLLMVETTDVLFAVDSIPAVFAVTQDPFLVFTSNVFAIMGLRSLYFAIAGLLRLFRFLKMSLVVLLAFIGLKMLAKDYVHIASGWSLLAILVILGIGVAASVYWPEDKEEKST